MAERFSSCRRSRSSARNVSRDSKWLAIFRQAESTKSASIAKPRSRSGGRRLRSSMTCLPPARRFPAQPICRFLAIPSHAQAICRFLAMPSRAQATCRFLAMPSRAQATCRFLAMPSRAQATCRFLAMPSRAQATYRFLAMPSRAQATYRFLAMPSRAPPTFPRQRGRRTARIFPRPHPSGRLPRHPRSGSPWSCLSIKTFGQRRARKVSGLPAKLARSTWDCPPSLPAFPRDHPICASHRPFPVWGAAQDRPPRGQSLRHAHRAARLEPRHPLGIWTSASAWSSRATQTHHRMPGAPPFRSRARAWQAKAWRNRLRPASMTCRPWRQSPVEERRRRKRCVPWRRKFQFPNGCSLRAEA